MKSSICIQRIAVPGLLLAALILAGCAKEGATPLTTSTQSAPAPSNLTPEQKKAYDEAVKNSQPPSGNSAGSR